MESNEFDKPDSFDKRIYDLAVKNGCNPIWYNGIFGWAYHCTCGCHECDQQCSMITLESAVL